VDKPLESLTTNLRGTENILEAASKAGKPVLIASSSEIYGKNGGGPLNEESDRIVGSPLKSRWSYSEYLERVLANTPEFQQCRDRLLQDVTLEWIAGIPLFPSTALELAGRVKKISNDVTFMLLFQPEWEYKQIEMPKLDPVLIVWQPIDDCGNEGIWLRVCEWGRDVMELEENE